MPVLRHYFGDDSILASRGLLVAVFCTFFVFPASLTTRMHSMLISNIGTIRNPALGHRFLVR